MHRSISKVNDLKVDNKKGHREYRKNKKQTIAETEKMVKHELLRVNEETKLNLEIQEDVQTKINDIGSLVYQDTIEQHQEKLKLDNMIEECDKDIEELERLIERKRKERTVFVLEKEVHERKIEQARMKYSDKINANKEAMQEIVSQLVILEEQSQKNQEDQRQLETDNQELTDNI